jgi:DNA mismatch endonuclease (patch repair protein)
MADKIDPARRSANMAKIASKNTKPELLVRRMLHALGYRFRLHRKDLPGKPDIVFPSRKAVIFVHGCFWHMHPDPTCKDARLPTSRQEYWLPKLERNVQRDAEAEERLRADGWRTLVIWDCETRREDLPTRLREFLDGAI